MTAMRTPCSFVGLVFLQKRFIQQLSLPPFVLGHTKTSEMQSSLTGHKISQYPHLGLPSPLERGKDIAATFESPSL